MKKRKLLLSLVVVIPFLYVGASFLLPYIVAMLRGAEIVAYTSNVDEAIPLSACVNGGGLHFSVIQEKMVKEL